MAINKQTVRKLKAIQDKRRQLGREVRELSDQAKALEFLVRESMGRKRSAAFDNYLVELKRCHRKEYVVEASEFTKVMISER
jgi:hypothetical protein